MCSHSGWFIIECAVFVFCFLLVTCTFHSAINYNNETDFCYHQCGCFSLKMSAYRDTGRYTFIVLYDYVLYDYFVNAMIHLIVSIVYANVIVCDRLFQTDNLYVHIAFIHSFFYICH